MCTREIGKYELYIFICETSAAAATLREPRCTNEQPLYNTYIYAREGGEKMLRRRRQRQTRMSIKLKPAMRARARQNADSFNPIADAARAKYREQNESNEIIP